MCIIMKHGIMSIGMFGMVMRHMGIATMPGVPRTDMWLGCKNSVLWPIGIDITSIGMLGTMMIMCMI